MGKGSTPSLGAPAASASLRIGHAPAALLDAAASTLRPPASDRQGPHMSSLEDDVNASPTNTWTVGLPGGPRAGGCKWPLAPPPTSPMPSA